MHNTVAQSAISTYFLCGYVLNNFVIFACHASYFDWREHGHTLTFQRLAENTNRRGHVDRGRGRWRHCVNNYFREYSYV